MKAYHLRTSAKEYSKDYLYIPRRNIFAAFYQGGEIRIKMDYSTPFYLDIARRIAKGEHVNPPINPSIVKIFEIDEDTVSKISLCRAIPTNGLYFDDSSESLVKILSEGPPQKSR